MNIDKALKKEGIEVVSQLDTLKVNTIAKNIAKKIVQTFPNTNLSEDEVFQKLSKLDMYKAKMLEGMAEANYFYKNTSIYFNDHIDDSDLEEFALHECIHYIQERKDSNDNISRMGLCDYVNNKPIELGLNEAAVQYLTSIIIGIKPDFEKYYDITLYTPSPSYYPLECSLLNEIIYFTGLNVLISSTLLTTHDFKNCIIEKTSAKTYENINDLFNKILNIEEKLIKLNLKINLLDEGSSKVPKLMTKSEKLKKQIADLYIDTQNIIIKEFFDYEFNNITNLEDLENFRRRLYKFSDIIGSVKDYNFFDSYYVETMNKLEHKNNVLENGGLETALSLTPKPSIFAIFRKFFNLFLNKKDNDFEKP